MKRICLAISASILSLMPASVGAVELIVNGGFEAGNFIPDASISTYDTITQTGTQDLTGWTVGNSLGWGVNATDINTHAGAGYVDLTGIGDTVPHGILNQTIATLVGQQYAFSIFATQDFVGIGFDVLANGVLLALVGTPGFWPYGSIAPYNQIIGVFTATTPSTTISIVGHSFSSTRYMIGLDDVSVTGPGITAAPIPAAFPLLATGLGGLGLLGWRRKRKNAGSLPVA